MKKFGTAAILCGGKSRRMGFDKSEIMIDDKLLIEHIAETLEEVFEEVIFITDDVRKYEHLKYPVYEDILPEKGPMGGIFTALNYAFSEFVFVTACDMPIVHSDFIRHMMKLIEKPEEGAASWKNGYIETLYAFYSKSMIERIELLLSREQFKLLDLIQSSKMHLIEEEEVLELCGDVDVFINLNKKNDLALLKEIFGGITISWRSRRL